MGSRKASPPSPVAWEGGLLLSTGLANLVSPCGHLKTATSVPPRHLPSGLQRPGAATARTRQPTHPTSPGWPGQGALLWELGKVGKEAQVEIQGRHGGQGLERGGGRGLGGVWEAVGTLDSINS